MILSVLCVIFSLDVLSATESTPYGKNTGIESRSWGMHFQTNFSDGGLNNCPVNVGDTYMYDFRHDNTYNGTSSNDEVSMLLAAFAAQSDIAFHIYGCNDVGSRPIIGHIRVRK